MKKARVVGMQAQAEKFGARIAWATVESIERRADGNGHVRRRLMTERAQRRSATRQNAGRGIDQGAVEIE